MEERTLEEKLDELNAIHEAGHAVMTLALGGTVLAMVLGDPWGDFGSVLRTGVVDREYNVMVTLAGPGAEVIHMVGGTTWSLVLGSSGRGDWRKARGHIEALALSRRVPKRVIVAEVKRTVIGLLTRHWNAVLALSALLAERRHLDKRQVLSVWEHRKESSTESP